MDTSEKRLLLNTSLRDCSNTSDSCPMMIESPVLNLISRRMIYVFVFLFPDTSIDTTLTFAVESGPAEFNSKDLAVVVDGSWEKTVPHNPMAMKQ